MRSRLRSLIPAFLLGMGASLAVPPPREMESASSLSEFGHGWQRGAPDSGYRSRKGWSVAEGKRRARKARNVAKHKARARG